MLHEKNITENKDNKTFDDIYYKERYAKPDLARRARAGPSGMLSSTSDRSTTPALKLMSNVMLNALKWLGPTDKHVCIYIYIYIYTHVYYN